MSRIAYVVTYDVADDNVHEDVAMFLSRYGPPGRKSVFEVELANATATAAFRSRLSAMIEPEDDQIRLYAVGPEALAQRIVYGLRTIEERLRII